MGQHIFVYLLFPKRVGHFFYRESPRVLSGVPCWEHAGGSFATDRPYSTFSAPGKPSFT